MGFQLPLLSLVMSVAGGAALHMGGKSPPLQSCWALTYLAFWYFMCLFYAIDWWAGWCRGGGGTCSELATLCSKQFIFLVNWEYCRCVREEGNYRICLSNEPTVGTLMKDINYSHSILLTVRVHISWPCTFWAYLTTFYCSTFHSWMLILQELQTVVF